MYSQCSGTSVLVCKEIHHSDTALCSCSFSHYCMSVIIWVSHVDWNTMWHWGAFCSQLLVLYMSEVRTASGFIRLMKLTLIICSIALTHSLTPSPAACAHFFQSLWGDNSSLFYSIVCIWLPVYKRAQMYLLCLWHISMYCSCFRPLASSL